MNGQTFHPARWNRKEGDDAIRCLLCPRHCLIAPGKTGYCAVRKNINGELAAISYGYPVAIQVDPIEKKPLYHFLPGTKIFSIGTFGCTLGCLFCQNDSLSAGRYNESMKYRCLSPEDIVNLAIQYSCQSIAFTYNEPTIFSEYAVDIAELAHKEGLKTVFVTNGFISPEAAQEIYPHIDAANFDMKGFSDDFYRTMCKGSLQPVLEAILYFRNTLKKHLELTNLVIPGKNDDPALIDAYLDWVEQNLGYDVPLHFSAYFPAFLYKASPRTSPELLHRIADHAAARGFHYIHLGNI